LADLLDEVTADEVGAAVAHVGEEGVVVLQEQRDDRGAHPGQPRVLLGLAVDGDAGSLDRGADRLGDGRVLQRGPRVEGGPLGGPGLAQLPVDGLHRDARGGAAAGVSAHAVGDDEQLQILVDEEAVLVVVALLAHIGQPTGDDLQPDRRWLGWGHAGRRWYRRRCGAGKETARVDAARGSRRTGIPRLTPPVARARASGRRAARPTPALRGPAPRRPRVPPR